MRSVSIAKMHGDMGSLGMAANKLIRQFNFPLHYEDDEPLLHADHDRVIQWDHEHAMAAFKRHMNTGDMVLASWARSASDKRVMALLEDLLKVKESENYSDVKWTGYRITGTVNRSNGYPVYSLWLFAKRKDSETEVFTGEDAPNVDWGEGEGIHYDHDAGMIWSRGARYNS